MTNTQRLVVVLLYLLMICPTLAADPDDHPARVVWDSPSADSRGSMPIGNGEIGANVWVEPSGDLVFYLSKTDAWSENCRLLKLGRVRVQIEPALDVSEGIFTQTLDPTSGLIRIESKSADRSTTVLFWIDAHHPVVHVDVDSDQPIKFTAAAEVWRTERRAMGGKEVISAYGLQGGGAVFVEPDTVVDGLDDRVVVYHRNERSIWADNLKLQALDELVESQTDPLLGRTFGYAMRGDGLNNASTTQLQSSAARKQWSLTIHPLTRQTDTAEQYLTALGQQVERDRKLDRSQSLAAHRQWWGAFWDRSWIVVTNAGSPIELPTSPHAWRVGVDSRGGSRFGGEINAARVIGHALSAAQIADLAENKPNAKVEFEEQALSKGCTVAAWIKPAPRETGRIIDNATVGRSDGFLFDTHPGLSLRWSVGRDSISASNCLKVDQWQHVAATVDAESGEQRIYIDGKQVADNARDDSPDRTISQAYAQQRWINACAGRGTFPIKFNGSIFTVDTNSYGADYRAWGGPYWWQNTRLPYWTMLYAGDYDLMRPLFEMYLDALPLRQTATHEYYGHGGAFFPETMYFWGTYNDHNYGRNRAGKPDGLTDNQYIRREWQGGIELVMMMLDHYDHTHDQAFRDRTLLPLAVQITTFYNEHWPRNEQGRIHMHPAQVLETWWNATNPMPEVAGLHAALPRLLKLPVDDMQKATWRDMLDVLPPIPTRQVNGKTILAPAEKFAQRKNMENGELYATFPYRLYTQLQDEEKFQIALNTWPHRNQKGTGGWFQNAIHAAMLGLTDEAARDVYANARGTAKAHRFGAMWGPNYDWVPDQDHGSVTMIALQRMVMQADGDVIRILPAWPKDWDVHFKLHAPFETAIECEYRNGKVVTLKVTPESRRQDVVLPDAE